MTNSPVAVHVQYDVRGADGHGHLVPLVVGQAVGEHLGVGLLASGAVVKTHLAPLAAALQLQEPAEPRAPVIIPHTSVGASQSVSEALFRSTSSSLFSFFLFLPID